MSNPEVETIEAEEVLSPEEQEKQERLAVLAKSIGQKIRGLGQRLTAFTNAVQEIAKEIVQVRIVMGDLAGETPEYKRWYLIHVDTLIGEVATGEEEQIDAATRAMVRKKLKYHVQEQLRHVLREQVGREQADAMLQAANLDPLSQSERNAAKQQNQRDAAKEQNEQSKAPSDTPSDTAELFPAAVAAESSLVMIAQSLVAGSLMLRERFESEEGQNLSGGDRKKLAKHLDRVSENLAAVTAGLTSERVAA